MRIRMSKRGLTFAFGENDAFKVGTRYRYIVDVEASEVILLPDENGKYRISRKGQAQKPLVDLRNEEIRKAMSSARYMEVEVCEDRIVVHIVKTSVAITGLAEAEISDLIDKADKVTFEISKEDLVGEHDALSEMLASSGLFQRETESELCYVFDTVSLFSGAGLLDWPFFKDESFDLRFAVDFDAAACRTYEANIGNHIRCMDIRNLDSVDVPDTDLIIGGPCCQGYSNANRAGNLKQDVAKRLLIDDYIRIVKAKKPLMFVIENVRQFLTKENGRYLNRVLKELSDDYNITYSVINDSDVGGYSIRERVILIGSCKAMKPVTIPDVRISRRKTVGEALKKVTPDWFNYADITRASEETKKRMAQVRPGHNFRDIADMKELDRHSNIYRRLAEDEPSVTITNWRKVCLMPPVGNRILSVAEAAAIMGLEKDFRFLGSINDRQQQVGNGVTQAIANFVKNVVKRALCGYAERMLQFG